MTNQGHSGTAAAVVGVGAFAAGAVLATWYARTRPESPVLPPAPEPTKPKAPPPGPCDAAFLVLSKTPDLDEAAAVAQAYSVAFPDCPKAPTEGECFDGMEQVKKCVEGMMKPAPKVVTKQPDNACDPLAQPPAGKICVPAGEIFVLAPEAEDAEVPFIEGVEPNEVRVTSSYETVSTGSAWPIQTMDAWLENRRTNGDLVTIQSATGVPIQLLETGLPHVQWDSLGWDGARAVYEATLGNSYGLVTQAALSASAAAALREFAVTHFVKTPEGTIRIADLPVTQAVHNFRSGLAAYIANFQKRTFEFEKA